MVAGRSSGPAAAAEDEAEAAAAALLPAGCGAKRSGEAGPVPCPVRGCAGAAGLGPRAGTAVGRVAGASAREARGACGGVL